MPSKQLTLEEVGGVVLERRQIGLHVDGEELVHLALRAELGCEGSGGDGRIICLRNLGAFHIAEK